MTNQAPSPVSEPSAVPVLTLTSQLQFHHQKDKLRSQGISRELQITLFIAFLVVNVPEQSTSGRQDADWPITRRRPCRCAEIGASKEGCPPTRGDRQIFNFQTLAPRRINRDFSFI